MGNSTAAKKGFPLWKHKGTGHWCKKIDGKRRYFGRNKQEALQRYLAEKDGPLPTSPTLKDLCNHYLTVKEQDVESGELKRATFNGYHRSCQSVLDILGKNREVADLSPMDFATLRSRIGKGLSVVTLKTRITEIRILFKFAYECNLIEKPVKYGGRFNLPTAKNLKIHKNEQPEQFLEPAEIRAWMDAGNPQQRAMILLAVNAAFYPIDCACLTWATLDLDGGWHKFPRPKTGEERRAKLWPETVAAINAIDRPKPKKGCEKLVFLDGLGRQWNENTISSSMHRLRKRAGVTRDGATFRALRHVVQTVGDETREYLAVSKIMGHSRGSSIDTVYRQRISNESLVVVANHIHNWLFPDEETE